MERDGKRRPRRLITRVTTVGWLLGLIAVLAAGGCGGDGAPAAAARPRLGLLIAPRALGDRGFIDQAHAALREAEGQRLVEMVLIEPATLRDQAASLQFFAEQKLAAVIAMGAAFEEGLRAVASSHPGLQCVMIDGNVSGPNLHGIVFREEEGSFLCGALAALVASGSPLGFVGGMDNPTIARFARGYRAGASHVATGSVVVERYVSTDYNGFNLASPARQLALEMYASGCAVIYHAAGGSGLGVIAAAVEAQRYAIGCDMDQDSLAPGRVLTSMRKRVDVVIAAIVRCLVDGRPLTSIPRSWGLAEGGLALSGFAYSADAVPVWVQEQVRQLSAELAAGRLRVE